MLNDALKTVRSLKNRIFECEYLLCKGNLQIVMLKFRDARRSFYKASVSKSPVQEDLDKSQEKFNSMTRVCKALKVLQEKFGVDYPALKVILHSLAPKDTLKETQHDDKPLECPTLTDNKTWLQKLGLTQESSNIGQVMSLFDKLGDLLSELDSFSVAVRFYQILLNLCQESQRPPQLQCTVLVSIAQTFLDDKRYDEAEKYFSQELEMRKNLNPRNLWEETRTSLKILECLCLSGSKPCHEIVKAYEFTIECYSEDLRCKIKILKDFLVFLDAEKLLDKYNQVEKQLENMDNAIGSIKNVSSEDDPSEGETSHSLLEPYSLESYPLSDASSLSSDDPSSDESDEERLASTYVCNQGEEGTSNRRNPKRLKKMKTNEVGETPLHRACIEGDVKKVQKLIDSGHPINPRDHCGWLPIHEAANHGHAEIVRVLIDNGASINDPGGDKCGGTTPLHDACSNANLEVIDVLVMKGADTVSFDCEGNTPLDCLQGWRTRVSHLEHPHDFSETVRLLETKMRETGFDVEAERRRLRVESSSASFKRRKIMDSRRMPVMAIDSEDEMLSDSHETSKKVVKTSRTTEETSINDPAVNEYESVMKNLRRNSDLHLLQELNEVQTCALIDASERLDVDEWLVKDTQNRKKRSHHELFESRSLPVIRHRIQSQETRKRNDLPRLEEVSREDVVAKTNGQVTSHLHPESSDGAPNMEQTFQEKIPLEKKVVLMKVRLESRIFLIKVPSEETKISWLIRETQSRYFQMEKTRPVIYLETMDGAILSPDDMIADVFQGSFEVIGRIQSFMTLSLEEEYVENCKMTNIDPNIDCRRIMEEISASAVMNLSHSRGVPVHQEKVIFQTIVSFEDRITCMDLSFMKTPFCKEVLSLLKKLTRLTEVKLQGLSVQKEDLDFLTSLQLNITLLDLSYNDFGSLFSNDSESSLAALIQSLKKLKTVFLISTDIPVSSFEDSLTKSIALHQSLRQVFVDDELLERLTSSVMSILRGRIQSQKWRSLSKRS